MRNGASVAAGAGFKNQADVRIGPLSAAMHVLIVVITRNILVGPATVTRPDRQHGIGRRTTGTDEIDAGLGRRHFEPG